MAFLICVLVLLSHRPPLAEVLTHRHLHDVGKLLLAFVMVWAYFSFSQLLVIWSGNLPEEIPWYLNRFAGGWQYIGVALVLLQFALPFALLLSRDLKRNFKLLRCVAVVVIVMRFVDLYWMVAPDFHKAPVHCKLDGLRDAHRLGRNLAGGVLVATRTAARCCRSAIRIWRRLWNMAGNNAHSGRRSAQSRTSITSRAT